MIKAINCNRNNYNKYFVDLTIDYIWYWLINPTFFFIYKYFIITKLFLTLVPNWPWQVPNWLSADLSKCRFDYVDRCRNDQIPFLPLHAPPQGFQNFSNVPVLHYLQAVLFLKNWTFFMNILYSMWPKVLPHVKKSLYNQPKPYF